MSSVDDAPSGHVGQTRGEFSVCQFLRDGSHEYVRRRVSAREAVDAAFHYCHSVGARMGMTTRVIITDGDDCACFEWIAGRGITFPKDWAWGGRSPERPN